MIVFNNEDLRRPFRRVAEFEGGKAVFLAEARRNCDAHGRRELLPMLKDALQISVILCRSEPLEAARMQRICSAAHFTIDATTRGAIA